MTRDAFYQELMMLNERFDRTQPELEVTVRDPEIDLEGYVVVWNTEISKDGPLGRIAKGGTRIIPTLTMDEIKMLARTMALKNAAADLPLGGAKSGLRARSDAATAETQYRRFVSLCKSFLAENGGPFGGFGFDVGARPEQALWACDELGSKKSFTGKPPEMGGTDYDRQGVAGIGVATAAKMLLELKGDSIADKSCAVQGTGNLGAAVLADLLQFGANVRFVSDLRLGGTIEFEDSPPPELAGFIRSHDFDSAKQYILEHGFKTHPVDHVLYQKVDILFPCALQDAIRADNVGQLQCRYLVEGANTPCTGEARAHLFQSGVKVIPDFIANPGGIIAAYVELLVAYGKDDTFKGKNIIDYAKQLTREKISKNIQCMMELVDTLDIEPAHAGRYIALKKLYGLWDK